AGNEERLDSHVDESSKGAGRVVGVQGAEHQVAGQSGLDGALGRLQVAHFADQDHIRVVTKDASQSGGERQSNLTVHLNLTDAFAVVLDRILDGDDLEGLFLDFIEGAVERGGLTGSVRSRD